MSLSVKKGEHMAEEVNNTENTENGNVQQDTNTGAANTEPEKKYSEEEMNNLLMYVYMFEKC